MLRIRFAAALLSLGLAGCNGFAKLDYTHFGRDTWQRPEDVVHALGVRPGDRVADIGAGTGYFVPHLSEAVGTSGRVYAVEVEPDVSRELEERYAGEDANVEVILGQYDDPLLPDGSIDVVLLVNTYHHVEERPDYFARLRADLSPDGRVAIIDPDAEMTGILGLFVEDGHESRAGDVDEEMRAAGYRRVESFDMLAIQIFEVFTPHAGVATRSSDGE
jgi:ubiquinone/menaquinone biosynthesis C-methylase UbiE